MVRNFNSMRKVSETRILGFQHNKTALAAEFTVRSLKRSFAEYAERVPSQVLEAITHMLLLAASRCIFNVAQLGTNLC